MTCQRHADQEKCARTYEVNAVGFVSGRFVCPTFDGSFFETLMLMFTFSPQCGQQNASHVQPYNENDGFEAPAHHPNRQES